MSSLRFGTAAGTRSVVRKIDRSKPAALGRERQPRALLEVAAVDPVVKLEVGGPVLEFADPIDVNGDADGSVRPVVGLEG